MGIIIIQKDVTQEWVSKGENVVGKLCKDPLRKR